MTPPKNPRVLPERLQIVVAEASRKIAASLTEADVLWHEAYGLGLIDGVESVARHSRDSWDVASQRVRDASKARRTHLRESGNPAPTSGHAR